MKVSRARNPQEGGQARQVFQYSTESRMQLHFGEWNSIEPYFCLDTRDAHQQKQLGIKSRPDSDGSDLADLLCFRSFGADLFVSLVFLSLYLFL